MNNNLDRPQSTQVINSPYIIGYAITFISFHQHSLNESIPSVPSVLFEYILLFSLFFLITGKIFYAKFKKIYNSAQN